MIVFVIIIIVIGVGYLLQNKSRKKIEEKGVYVIGIVKKTEIIKYSHSIIVDYTYKGKIYSETLDSKYGGEIIGQLVFLKLLTGAPKQIIYFQNPEVPDCLKMNYKDSVWNELPTCPK